MSIGSAVFAQFTVVSHYFTMCRYVSPKIAPASWGSGPPSNTWHLRPTRVISPNGISIGSAVLYGSQILCCTMHCQWGRKPTKLPLFLGISSPCRRKTEPWPWVACREKLVKIAGVTPDIGYIRFTPWFYSVLTCLRAKLQRIIVWVVLFTTVCLRWRTGHCQSDASQANIPSCWFYCEFITNLLLSLKVKISHYLAMLRLIRVLASFWLRVANSPFY